MPDWRTLPGLSRYEISDDGLVRRKVNMGAYKAGGLLRGGRHAFGYPTVTLQRDDGKQVTKTVHSMVCEAFHGPRPTPKHCVAHNDGNPANCRKDNLRWATQSENILDAVRHGTLVDNRGERHGNAKLTEDMVRQIRSDPLSCRKAGAKYGVANQIISKIRLGQLWKHVDAGGVCHPAV